MLDVEVETTSIETQLVVDVRLDMIGDRHMQRHRCCVQTISEN